MQLGFCRGSRIVNTSNIEGQIYVPVINWFLCAGVAALVLVFQNSNRLTEIYGVAVTGTFILNTILFAGAVARDVEDAVVAAVARCQPSRIWSAWMSP